MQKYLVLVVLITLFASACDKVSYKRNPELSYNWQDKYNIQAGSNDTAHFYLTYYDDDGDLGSINGGTPNTSTITLKDSRTNGNTLTFPFPDIKTDPDFKSGYKGEITVSLSGKDVWLVDSIGLYDTIRYDIFVTDNKGNESNSITAEPLLITQ